MKTRWYPRGIQKLVSTYELPENRGWGVLHTNSNSKCQDLSKSVSLGGVGGWVGGGGGEARPTFLKYLTGGTQILSAKFW